MRAQSEIIVVAAGVVATAIVGLALGAAATMSWSYVVAMLGALTCAPLVWRRPAEIATAGIVVGAVFSGFVRGLPIPMARLSEVGVLAAGATLWSTAARSRRPPWRVVDWTLAAFAAVHLLLPVGNALRGVAPPLTTDDLFRAAGPVMYLVVYRVVRTYGREAGWRGRLVSSFLVTSIAVSLIGIAQAAHAPLVERVLVLTTGTGSLFASSEYRRQTRATSLFGHWHPFAAYLVVMCVLCIATLVNRTTTRERRLAAVAGACAVLALVSTVTVAAAIGLVVAGLVVAVRHARLASALVVRLLPFATLGLIVMWPAISLRLHNQFASTTTTGLPNGVDFRVRVWGALFDALRGHWLVGYGVRLPSDVSWLFTENQYLTLLLRGGVVLLATFGVLCFVTVDRSQRAARRGGPETRVYADTVVAITIAMTLIMFWVAPYFTFPGVSVLFWSLVALTVEAEAHGRTSGGSQQRKSSRHEGSGAALRADDQLAAPAS